MLMTKQELDMFLVGTTIFSGEDKYIAKSEETSGDFTTTTTSTQSAVSTAS